MRIMQNQQIIEQIGNLKGRRNYEEKKAAKLGFNSLYEYFEDKLEKEKLAVREKRDSLEKIAKNKKMLKQKKIDRKISQGKSCSCC